MHDVLKVVFLSVALVHCGPKMIAGTQVRNTQVNREIVAVLASLREAMETRNQEKILSLVSSNYFEDMATPDPSDDYGYEELRTKILPQSFDVTQEMYVSFEIKDIQQDHQKAYADVRYRSRARLDLPRGSMWDSHKEFNRIEFERTQNTWKIVSGL